MSKTDEELRELAHRMKVTRYTGWRNFDNKWREVMGLDEAGDGRELLDFGCGLGVESLELARAGYQVRLADISRDNLAFASRLLKVHGYETTAHHVLMKAPYLEIPNESLDVFFASGVIHHIPWAREIMKRASELLRPLGEARLMLYSDRGWREATGTEPPEDVTADLDFQKFVRHFDAVGEYADWYSQQRLESRFGEWFAVERFSYLTGNGRYLAATLRKKS